MAKRLYIKNGVLFEFGGFIENGTALEVDENTTDFVIPEGVTIIRNWTFSEFDNLVSITIPDSVTKIGEYAFKQCDNLVSITIPDSVTEIGEAAFWMCWSLTNVNLPKGIKEIKKYTFESCSKLTDITIPEGVTKIGDHAFGDCRMLTSIIIPESVKSIGSAAFEDCWSLNSITIPKSVKKIGQRAFSNCKGLTSVTISQGVKEIGSKAFENCSNLTEVMIPASVRAIHNNAFAGCDHLQKVVLPEQLEVLGNEVFRDCRALTEITIPASVKKIGYGAFLNCSYIQIRTEPCSYAEKWLHEENLKPTDQIERPLEEWKKFFHFSMRIQGARIMKIKVDTDAIYIPERFENVDVALIAQDAFKKEMVVLCSKRLFTKLPKETKVHTAAAYLQGNYQFTEEQKTYLTDYASKNREAIIEKCIQQDDAQALSRCLSLGKKSNAMWEIAFAKATEVNAVHCLAMLLEYKHTHLAERSKGSEFSLN